MDNEADDASLSANGMSSFDNPNFVAVVKVEYISDDETNETESYMPDESLTLDDGGIKAEYSQLPEEGTEAGVSASHTAVNVKVENEVTADGTSDAVAKLDKPTPGSDQPESVTCMPDLLPLPDAEMKNIEVENSVMSLGIKRKTNTSTGNLAAKAKRYNKMKTDDGTSSAGNTSDFFQISQDQKMKVEGVDVKSTGAESPSSCWSALEPNIVIKEEKDLDITEETDESPVEHDFQLSDTQRDDKSFQSGISSVKVNDSSVWGLCEEDCSDSSQLDEKSKLLEESQKSSGHCDGSNDKLAGVSIASSKLGKPAPQNRKGKYECPQCFAKFTQKHYLEEHLVTHSDERPFACTQCPATFKRKHHLKSHLSTHTDERMYPCTCCPMKFRQRQHLYRHLKTHTDAELFSCKYCRFKFKSSADLDAHLATHAGEKSFACPSCPAKFEQKRHLNHHIATHTDENQLACTYCPAKFKYNSNLKSHLLIHTKERPFACSYCPSKFRLPATLRVHMKVHTGEKPFSCTDCAAKFARKSDLTCHMRTHTNEKPYSCSYCNARFAQHSTWMQHLSVHSDEKRFTCQICSAKFKKKSVLKTHLVTHSNEKRFACIECFAKFKRRDHLKSHMRLIHKIVNFVITQENLPAEHLSLDASSVSALEPNIIIKEEDFETNASPIEYDSESSFYEGQQPLCDDKSFQEGMLCDETYESSV